MTAIDSRIEDRLAIADLNDDFGYHLDHGNVDEFLALFTDDVLYSNAARTLSGKAEMQEFFRNRAAGGRVSRHVFSGLRIEFSDQNLARAGSVGITFAGSGSLPIRPAEPFVVADLNDVYRRSSDGKWQFCERHITPIFMSESIPALPFSASGENKT